MLEHTYPGRLHTPVACWRTEEHPCWLGRGTPPQSGRIHPVMTVQLTWPPCQMLPTRLQHLPRKKKL